MNLDLKNIKNINVIKLLVKNEIYIKEHKINLIKIIINYMTLIQILNIITIVNIKEVNIMHQVYKEQIMIIKSKAEKPDIFIMIYQGTNI